jgi:hypothetical protein
MPFTSCRVNAHGGAADLTAKAISRVRIATIRVDHAAQSLHRATVDGGMLQDEAAQRADTLVGVRSGARVGCSGGCMVM